MGNLHILHNNYSFCSEDKIIIYLAIFFYFFFFLQMRNCNLTWTWWLRSFSSWISYCTTLLTVPLTPPDLTWTVKLSRKRFGYEGFNTNFSWSYKTNHQIVKQKSFYKIHLGRIFSPSFLHRQLREKGRWRMEAFKNNPSRIDEKICMLPWGNRVQSSVLCLYF